jgi:hypothetical protein
MIIVKLFGGIGNQMFQYAFGKALSNLLGLELFLDIDVYLSGKSNRQFDLDIFNISNVFIGDKNNFDSLLEENEEKIVYINERTFIYDIALIDTLKKYAQNPNKNDIILIVSGYWQSPKYFESIKSDIKKEFQFSNKLTGKWEKLQMQLLIQNSVMINVRRTDYLKKLEYHGVVTKEYLYDSIRLIRKTINNPIFYVFSDDIPWCRNNLLDKDLIFVDESYYDEKYQYYLHLMTSCKYFILANSSFCWWAAYLAPYYKKLVIAPQKWFVTKDLNTKDLHPSSWIKL